MVYDDSELLMRALAGLGLLFVGIKMVTGNLGAIAGDQFRRGLKAASERTGVAVVLGIVAGFVTQSGRTTSFLVASFVQAGLIEVRRALPIVLWSNLGCTLVIFAAVLPIYLFALFLLAIAGVCIAFERPKPLLNSASATFGLALMLFGLQMMSSSAAVLTSLPVFATALAFIKTSLIFAFLMGVALTLVAQSHIAVMLIAIAMAARGVFDFDQTLMVIYGAHGGSSLITAITGVHFRGQPRQVVTGQVLYNVVGIILFLVLFAVVRMVLGHPESAFAGPPGTKAALVAVAFNIATPLLLTAALPVLYRLCVRLAPPLAEEDLGRPQFLREEVSDSVGAILVLAEQEQLRLLKRLPAYLAWIRADGAAVPGPTPEAYHQAFIHVGQAIERFQGGAMSKRMTPEDTEWLVNQQKRQELLRALDETCHDLWDVSRNASGEVAPLRDHIVEALDTIVLTAISGMAEQDSRELDLLDAMTRSRGPSMERARKSYLAASDSLPPDERNRIVQITSLFERAAWTLHRFGVLLREQQKLAA
jgi:phosphate:Na+ symporter